jgi:hypothetical protein
MLAFFLDVESENKKDFFLNCVPEKRIIKSSANPTNLVLILLISQVLQQLVCKKQDCTGLRWISVLCMVHTSWLLCEAHLRIGSSCHRKPESVCTKIWDKLFTFPFPSPSQKRLCSRYAIFTPEKETCQSACFHLGWVLTVTSVVRPATRLFVLTSERSITFANTKCLRLTDLNAAGKEVLDRIEQQADSGEPRTPWDFCLSRSIDYPNALFCYSTDFSIVKDLCRFLINVKYFRGWSMLLSLKTLLVLREFLFLEPSIQAVNKPANDVGQLEKRDLQTAFIRPIFLLHEVTFL